MLVSGREPMEAQGLAGLGAAGLFRALVANADV